jgi:hypothetical protein
LLYRGRAAGIGIEGGEPVLTANVSRNPLLLSAASAINVAAGGAPLLPRACMALGRVAPVGTANSLRGDPMLVDPKALGQAVAAVAKTHIETEVSNIKRELARNAYNNGINRF